LDSRLPTPRVQMYRWRHTLEPRPGYSWAMRVPKTCWMWLAQSSWKNVPWTSTAWLSTRVLCCTNQTGIGEAITTTVRQCRCSLPSRPLLARLPERETLRLEVG
jgi:hypothetical protein